MTLYRLRNLFALGTLLCALLVFGYAPSVVQAVDCPDFSTGTHTLTQNCTMTSRVNISGTVVINGGGYTMTMGGNRFNVGGGDDLTLNNVTITGATGGAISQANGSLTITNSTFSGNSVAGSGGAISQANGSLTITNSTFSGNSAHQGGAISQSGGSLTITNSTFSDNENTGFGGAIFQNGGSLTILTITNSTFSGNSSTYQGGAIFQNSGSMTITNSTFSANITSDGGGAIFQHGGSMTITNSTFSGNSALSGGAIYLPRGSLTLRNSILANNTPDDCYAIDNDTTVSFSADTSNIIESSSTCGTSANYLAVDPNLGSLTDGYFPLSVGSPAIDAGDDATCSATSQNGVARPSGDACDLGSYEYEEIVPTTVPTSIPPTVSTTVPDIVTTPLPGPTPVLVPGEVGSTAPITNLLVPNTTAPFVLATDSNGGSLNPGVDGNITGQVIAVPNQPITPDQGARIGNFDVIKRGVISALDVTLFNPNGQPLTAFARPIQICLYGTGNIVFLASNTNGARTPIELGGSPTGSGYTCVTLTEPGTLVLVQN